DVDEAAKGNDIVGGQIEIQDAENIVQPPTSEGRKYGATSEQDEQQDQAPGSQSAVPRSPIAAPRKREVSDIVPPPVSVATRASCIEEFDRLGLQLQKLWEQVRSFSGKKAPSASAADSPGAAPEELDASWAHVFAGLQNLFHELNQENRALRHNLQNAEEYHET
ncbi:unnamed protein product, partial [Amoebophrya sp. A120]